MANVGPTFTLSQLIEKTADELRVLKKTPKSDAVMQFTGCELELAVTLAAGAKGEIKFLLMGNWSAEVKGETVSRIKLNFGPLNSGQGPSTSKTPGQIGFGEIQGADAPIVAGINLRNLPTGEVP